MRAVRYHGPKQPLRLEEIPSPVPGPGELLIKVRAAGICHTELHFLSGLLDLGVKPLTLGHEICGTVEAVGPGVDQPAIGQRVVLYYYVGCGKCEYCLRGDENLCVAPKAEYGFITDGGFAEYVTAPARNAVPVPDNLTDIEIAPVGCSVTTAIHAGNLAGIQAGQTVLVYGIGAVGYGLVQLARLLGATVIAVGRSRRKLELAEELGAGHIIDGARENVAQQVSQITHGRGVDIIFELVATDKTMQQSVESVARRGKIVFIGYSFDSFTVHPIQLVIKEATVLGSVGNSLAELHQAVDWMAAGRIRTVIDRSLGLEHFQEAIEGIQAGELVGRAVLIP